MADDLDTPYEPDPDTLDDIADGPPVPRGAQIRRRVQSQAAKKVVKSRGVNTGRIMSKEKQRKALELRKGGASYQAIADAVGYADASGARKAVMTAFSEINQEPAQELKTLQIERLNHMLLTLWPKVQSGDERAIDTSLRVMDKIDRLMGTEEARKVDMTVTQQQGILVIDGDKDDFIRAMKTMAGIQGDGTNAPALPAGDTTTAPPTGMPILEGVVVDDDRPLSETLTPGDINTIHSIMAPPTQGSDGTDPAPTPYVEAPKKYRFGVDPE